MKMYVITIGVLIFLTHNTIFAAQHGQEKTISFNSSKINYKIISSTNNTWGYDIFIDNKLKIHQTTIPGLTGSEGFKTKEASEKVPRTMIDKMIKGTMPPTITIEEMKKN